MIGPIRHIRQIRLMKKLTLLLLTFYLSSALFAQENQPEFKSLPDAFVFFSKINVRNPIGDEFHFLDASVYPAAGITSLEESEEFP